MLLLWVLVILCAFGVARFALAPRGPPATMTGAFVGGRGGFFCCNPTVAGGTAARFGGAG